MKCKFCGKEDPTVAAAYAGFLLCRRCRKTYKSAAKKKKAMTRAASYHEALARPDLRGLKGARK